MVRILPHVVALITVKWYEQSNRIKYHTVCYSYPQGAADDRGCRGYAQRYFKQQCTRYRQLAKQSATTFNRNAKAKFCNAARTFNPL